MGAECQDFGVVIIFDMTHKTNKHMMPLAMFLGSNHQLQNVVFDQSLLRDESSNSFEWLFKTFKTCMGRHKPHVFANWYVLLFCNLQLHILAVITHCPNHKL
jgi:hypothetical protein